MIVKAQDTHAESRTRAQRDGGASVGLNCSADAGIDTLMMLMMMAIPRRRIDAGIAGLQAKAARLGSQACRPGTGEQTGVEASGYEAGGQAIKQAGDGMHCSQFTRNSARAMATAQP